LLTLLICDGNGMWPVKSFIEYAEPGLNLEKLAG